MRTRVALILACLAFQIVAAAAEDKSDDDGSHKKSALIGYSAVAVAVFCFGSYGLPVKLVRTGDGMFYQWVVCCGVLTVGMIVQFFEPHKFEPFAAAGGAIWCLGNVVVVPVVKVIGLGLGLLVWGSSNMLTGWSAGKFGIHVGSFNLPKEDIASPIMNYCGVAIALVALAMYFPIKSTTRDLEKEAEKKKKPAADDYEKYAPLLDNTEKGENSDVPAPEEEEPEQKTASLPARVAAFATALVAGVMYGSNMLPIKWLQNKNSGSSPIMFAASHFTGIFLCSTAVLVVYCLYKKNKPVVYPEMILPAFFSGVLWAVAQCGWFYANDNLGLAVAFPMICSGPGVVGNFYGLVFFREISGMKNLTFLFLAFGLTFVGIMLIALSH